MISGRSSTRSPPPVTPREQAVATWLEARRKTCVLEDAGRPPSTYYIKYIKTKQPSPGEPICDCGYMVESAARG
tara:strand:- start:767 stop:988 length:222 start_codon:yes stop_codon:yes gene_type:complete